jgi:hypothetical protein
MEDFNKKCHKIKDINEGEGITDTYDFFQKICGKKKYLGR